MATGRRLEWGRPQFEGNTFQVAPDGSLFLRFGGVFRSDDGGRNWHQATGQGLPWFVARIAVTSEGVLVGVGTDPSEQGTPLQVFHSENSGAFWTEQLLIDAPPVDVILDFLALSSGDLLVVTFNFEDPEPESHRILRSADGGRTWSNTHTQKYGGSWSLVEAPDGTVFASPSDPGGALVISKDRGQTWTNPEAVGSARSFGFVGGDYFVGSLVQNQGSEVPAGILLRSLDGGASWTDSGSELPADTFVCSMAGASQGTLFAAVAGLDGEPSLEKNSIYRSDDGGQQWTAVTTLFPTYTGRDHDLAVCRDLFYTPAGELLVLTSGMPRSTDLGQTWSRADRGLPQLEVNRPRFGPDGALFAGGDEGLTEPPTSVRPGSAPRWVPS